MIPRYSRNEISSVWDTKNKFQIWLDIEIHATQALANKGEIPQQAAEDLARKGKFEIERIDEIELEVKHDVIAFLTNVAEHVGSNARFVHQGLTSSDILDTCLAVQLSQSAKILISDLDKLLEVLKKRALQHKYDVCIGRSHGIHAEPTTFGLKLAQAYAEFDRARARLINAREEISTCAISGAVGTFANIDPSIESYVAEQMGLKIEPVSSQIIPRDRHAFFFSTLGVISGSAERIATEIRHLQRTEVREVEEFFEVGQKGSSAMPHNRNPILTEHITGLARVVRAAVIPAIENISLWHERDISHSAVERIFAPDATIALDFALHRLAIVIDKLIVHPKRMLENVDILGGLIFSQGVLLALTKGGMSREDSYKIVQECAGTVWDNGGSLLESLQKDKRVLKILSKESLISIFDLKTHTKHVDTIFERVFD